MLAVALPAASICLVVVLRFILQLTGEGDEPDPEVTIHG